MGCHGDTARTIRKQEADYSPAIKKNPPTQLTTVPTDGVQAFNSGYGRVETQLAYVIRDWECLAYVNLIGRAS